MKIQQFAGSSPALKLEDYFTGDIDAWGIFEDRLGNLRRQFTVSIHGEYDGKHLTLSESFLYDDGEADQRFWTITPSGDNRYVGVADDVVGQAEGIVCGNAFYWSYKMRLKVGKHHIKVKFDDWMYLQPKDTLINRAKVSRWGITLGYVTLFFQPEQKTQSQLTNMPIETPTQLFTQKTA